ncbi:nuclear transport factor 2 family protein [Rhizobium grahamii]|uniref:Nuclear transport factor 2 family protein n=1 Tax=Rhizobium grahamii TaxID=1120045 RepID=A0A5Q0C0A0_9HYPH|nr:MULTISPECIES: nuclear transport factor 2 family protein [Rhizobium]QFY59298.1 nuclear transport factor 2 family protein [Rhizobium grahamii]QRM48173.1 nuclear transport factor 2 family protein [Rhizobium sp. BG6]
MQKLVESFIATANAFDVEGALSLFATDAVIDDASVGNAFVGRTGVRQYLERFFVGYSTSSKLLSMEELDTFHSSVRLDFTGDFGHEIGTLKIAINSAGLIERIDADLE